jgi:threonine dehydrogenase-like Zn-dependent dehydrogenase
MRPPTPWDRLSLTSTCDVIVIRLLKCCPVAGMAGLHELVADRRAHGVIDPTSEGVVARVDEPTGGESVDHAFEAAGLELTRQTAVRATRKGGWVTIISIWENSIDPNEIVLAELDIHGIIAYTPQDFADTIAMITDGRIDTRGVVTSRIDLGTSSPAV